MDNKKKPTKSELEILSVIWEQGEATVREVFEIFRKTKKSTYTTVLKTMQIMHGKGFVGRVKVGNAHVYRALIKQSELGRSLIDDLLKKVFGGSASKLVQQVLENETTSADEMQEIRKMIDESQKGAK